MSTVSTQKTGSSHTPIGWTENHRAEILGALYTILLGNPQLKAPPDAEGKTRFKMWWRLIGSALEHGAHLIGEELDFQKLFLNQEEEEEEAASLADALEAMLRNWPVRFRASDVAGLINTPTSLPEIEQDQQTLREFLLPSAPPDHAFSAKTVTRLLKKHLDEAVRGDKKNLVLRRRQDLHTEIFEYRVEVLNRASSLPISPGFAGFV